MNRVTQSLGFILLAANVKEYWRGSAAGGKVI